MRDALGGIVLCALAAAGCSALAAEGTAPLPVPTFSAPAADAPGATTGGGQEGALPDDCARVISPAEVEALLGRPIGTVTVRTVEHRPSPAVGRTERVVCRYTSIDGAAELLGVDLGAFVDAAAAAAQWERNRDAEDGTPTPLTLGRARAALVPRPGGTALLVVDRATTLTLTLSERVRVGDSPAGQTLADLALRILPVVSGPVPAPPPEQPADTSF